MATPFASRKYVNSATEDLFDTAYYDSDSKKIIFKHGSTQKAYIDATAFIKDGMVSTVAIVNVPDDEEPSGVADGDYIKVKFNTDAGSDPIYIPLTDIFNPANYYDKTAADGRFVQKETGKWLFSGSYNDLTDKPTIPAPVSVDATLTTQGAAADAKAVGDALAAKQDALSAAQLANIAAVPNKANTTDLHYALATLTPGSGTWSFSGASDEIAADLHMVWSGYWVLTYGSNQVGGESGDEDDLSVTFTNVTIGSGDVSTITATRPYAHGATLLDRAVNAVPVTGATTLTLPALVNAGKARDLLVRLEISGSTVPTITISPDGNESVTYETDSDEFPVPDAEGTWLYSFTETAAHTFAVSLKKVNTVTQGGA